MVQFDPQTGATDSIESLGAPLTSVAKRGFVRCVLVFSGEEDWCLSAAQSALCNTGLQTVLWVSNQAPAGSWRVSAERFQQLLGRETDAVVFNSFSGFDADAFGAVSGTVRGGGLFILLAPSFQTWPDFPDPENRRITVAPFEPSSLSGRFLRRLSQIVAGSTDITVVEQGRPIPQYQNVLPEFDEPERRAASLSPEAPYRTRDQQQAVAAVKKVVTGQRRRPVVLTSDRGRGKSSALGIASAQLLREGVTRILVTAPQLEASETIFSQAGRLLPDAHCSHASLRLGEASIEFVAPDELVRTPRQADLLLVDEAAAIPTPILNHLLCNYSRIAFATTIHGYEGTGQGFAVRFLNSLDKHTRGWRTCELQEPIRWAVGDPLEKFVFRALLLDAEAVADDVIREASTANCSMEWLDRDQLVEDEETLSELFGLLVLAHYRTRPYDLRNLLDGPNIEICVLRFAGHVIATVVVAREGGFEPPIADAIWTGQTRPHGHLLPESLAAHVGIRNAPCLRCYRVLRIAVHPAAQRKGLGTMLVEESIQRAMVQRFDYVGASFGATNKLLEFWYECGLFPVRVSVKRGASSGEHSVLLCQSLSEGGKNMLDEARRRFEAHFSHQLSDTLRDLEPDLVINLHRQGNAVKAVELGPEDWQDVIAFAFGKRIYEVCIGAIWRLVSMALFEPGCQGDLEKDEACALVCKVLQKHDWQSTAKILGVDGRNDVVQVLRSGLRIIVSRYAGDRAKQFINLFSTENKPNKPEHSLNDGERDD